MSADRIELLRSLWEGDSDIMAYQHSAIVFDLCTLASQFQTPTRQWVLNHLHASCPEARECDDDELEIIDYGLKRWQEAGCPRVDVQELVNGS